MFIDNGLPSVTRPFKWTKLGETFKIKFLLNSTGTPNSNLGVEYFYLHSCIFQAENPRI